MSEKEELRKESQSAANPDGLSFRDYIALKMQAVAGAAGIEIRYAEENYCEATLYNSAGLPAFPFTTAL